jgi:hypothetical protein
MVCYTRDVCQKINHQNESYKVDNGIECGKDRLSGVTWHSRKAVKNMSVKTVSFLYFVYDVLRILFCILFLYCNTMQSFFCYFAFRIQENIKKKQVSATSRLSPLIKVEWGTCVPHMWTAKWRIHLLERTEAGFYDYILQCVCTLIDVSDSVHYIWKV